MNIELLCPASDLESVSLALTYGADAVYLGGDAFGLRASAGLGTDDLKTASTMIHQQGKKLFLTVNVFHFDSDIDDLEKFIKAIRDVKIDAFIVSDLLAKEIISKNYEGAVFHLSTQANVTNSVTANKYFEEGFSRIVLGREVDFKNLKIICSKAKGEIEIFAHGAMCMAYSGRCFMSSMMLGRSANKGDCAQPCRWNYAITEQFRPDEHFLVEENEQGTFLFNSKDLCLLEHLQELLKNCEIASLKIEGRMKSPYYVASVARGYRHVLDAIKSKKTPNLGYWMDELSKTSHREFTSGFLFQDNTSMQRIADRSYVRNYDFVGKVVEDSSGKANPDHLFIECRNNIKVLDELEIFYNGKDFETLTVEKIYDSNMELCESANVPKSNYYIETKIPLKIREVNSLLRKKVIE